MMILTLLRNKYVVGGVALSILVVVVGVYILSLKTTISIQSGTIQKNKNIISELTISLKENESKYNQLYKSYNNNLVVWESKKKELEDQIKKSQSYVHNVILSKNNQLEKVKELYKSCTESQLEPITIAATDCSEKDYKRILEDINDKVKIDYSSDDSLISNFNGMW